MASWSDFAADAPQLAGEIRFLLQQYGPGLGYLATVRADGGPRVHPVSPVITAEGLFCFALDSPKRRDLERDGRYALHSFPPEESDDEAYVAGRALPVTEPERVARIAAQSQAAPHVDWRLFEFTVEVAMLSRQHYGAHGAGRPAVRIWLDSAGGGNAGPAVPSTRGERRARNTRQIGAHALAPCNVPPHVSLVNAAVPAP